MDREPLVCSSPFLSAHDVLKLRDRLVREDPVLTTQTPYCLILSVRMTFHCQYSKEDWLPGETVNDSETLKMTISHHGAAGRFPKQANSQRRAPGESWERGSGTQKGQTDF